VECLLFLVILSERIFLTEKEMKIKFELDCKCDEPINKDQLFELCKGYNIPFILFTHDVTENSQLPSGWYMPGEVFLCNSIERATSLKTIISKSISCEIFRLTSEEYVKI
jgi:hypothetical protein